MSHADRLRMIHHGGIVLLVGLLCGLAVVPEEEPMRLWHTAHESLIMVGILIFAVSSVVPHIRLPEREGKALMWALLANGYGLTVGLLIQGITSQHAFSPSSSPVPMVGFIANTIGIGGSVIMASLVIIGARAARREARVPLVAAAPSSI
jgi:hypothetical protein